MSDSTLIPDGAPISTFPVTDRHVDAPDGARLVDDEGRLIERHGETWWVLAEDAAAGADGSPG